jgi:hypothetical protein
VTDAPHGLNRGEVRLEPADALPEDDRFCFSLDRGDPRPALFVHSPGSRDLLYFRAALESSGRSPFRLEEARPEQVATLDLTRFAFVALSDAAEAPAESLKNYLNAGGALLIALGPHSRRLPLLATATLQDRFFGRDYQGASWPGVRFYQAVAADIPQARVLERLGDGTPILTETSVGEGRVLIFGSTFDNLSNDFPLHPSFVPFVEQTANSLGGADAGVSSYTVDSFLQLRAVRERGVAVDVLDPQGRRALSLEEAAKADSLPLERAGFYEIHRNNGRQELAAANPDRRESDLTPVPADTLALWRNTAQPVGATPSGAPRAAERSLWPWVLAMALLVALAESLLGNRYLDAPQAEEQHRKAAA